MRGTVEHEAWVTREIWDEVTEGSRELDLEIVEVCNVDTGGYSFLPRRFHYTTSIDAALTLVPETTGGNKAGFLHATMYQRCVGDIDDNRIALALCIASLKARSAKD